MFERIHRRLGTAGFIISIVALVAALGGGAYAASGGLNGKQKKEVEKIAKKFAGKPGTNGANGTNGSPGAKGEPGAAGTNGTNGTPAEGTSFSGEKKVGSVACKEGGVEVKSASPATAVCNGAKGTTGFTKTLPVGSTETGSWSFGPIAEASTTAAFNHQLLVPVASFAIPLAAGLDASHVHYVDAEGEEINEEREPVASTACLGSAAAPKATSGNLCVYTAHEEGLGAAKFYGTASTEIHNSGASSVSVAGASTSGAFQIFEIHAESVAAFGTWAVTG